MGPSFLPAPGVVAFAAPPPPPASASAAGRLSATAAVTGGSLRAAASAAAAFPRRRLSRHHGAGAAPLPAASPSAPLVLPPIAGMGNSFGRLFRISTWGESHGGGVGVTIDGVPPHLPLTVGDIQAELARRRPGQSRIVTPRNEADAAEILSGVVDGLTVGTPVAVLVRNKDHRSQDYDTNAVAYRPSHADATYDAKYGTRAVAGGGRSSARETIGRVAGGAVAKKILSAYAGVEIVGYVQRVLDVELTAVDHDTVSTADVEANMIRCPDAATAERMIELVDEIRRTGNSVGGVVEVVARHVPAGLGSPVFDKLEADLAKACMSLPASKGFEVGSGFEGTRLTGFDHNDPFRLDTTGRTRAATNRSGGIQGGIANGETIVLRVAFKPTSTIGRVQQTVTRGGVETELRGKGRHDPCVLPRAVPMVEAMVALVLADALMAQVAQCELLPRPAGGAGAPNPLGPAAVPGTVLAAKQAAERAAKAAAAAAAAVEGGEEDVPAAAAPELTS